MTKVTQKKTKPSIERRIKTAYNRIKKLYKDLPENKYKLCDNLIQNVAFMEETLKDLQEKINNEGAVLKAKNGNGFNVVSEHPAQKSYNNMISKYQAAVKTLADMLPDDGAKIESKLGAFLNDQR